MRKTASLKGLSSGIWIALVGYTLLAITEPFRLAVLQWILPNIFFDKSSPYFHIVRFLPVLFGFCLLITGIALSLFSSVKNAKELVRLIKEKDTMIGDLDKKYDEAAQSLAKETKQHHQAIGRLEESKAEVARDARSKIAAVLKNFSIRLGFSERERMSVYVLEGEFWRIGCFSKSPKYNQGGRRIYPANKGVLSIALRDGSYYIDSLPDPTDYDNYVKVMKERCKLDEKTVKSLTMKSRCYFAIIMEPPGYSSEPTRLIVVESLEEKLPQKEKVEDLLKNDADMKLLGAMCADAPHVWEAMKEGY